MSNFVTLDECEQMHDAFEEGDAFAVIAGKMGYKTDTVRTHVKDRCKHGHEVGEDPAIRPCPFCSKEVGRLPGHLLSCGEAP